MIDFLGEVLALGIAGFDPLGAVILLTALGMGAHRRRVLVLMLQITGTIAVLTLAASLGLAQVIDPVSDFVEHLPRHLWAVVAGVLGVVMLGWGVSRLSGRSSSEDESPESRWTSGRSIALAGLAVGASCMLDPAWYGVVVLAGAERSIGRAVLASALWPMCSQVVMLVIGALALAGHGRAARVVALRLRESVGHVFGRFISVAMVLVGALAIVEAVAEWNGHWLLPG